MEWLQEYYFLHVGTLWDESKHILFSSDEYSNIAKLLFSTWWNIAWCIKTIFLLKYYMQWLHEYYFLHVGIFCDTSKLLFFLGIVCSDCKNSVFFMLGHFVMHQNELSFEVVYAMIAKILFSTCLDLLWWFKTNLVWRWQIQNTIFFL